MPDFRIKRPASDDNVLSELADTLADAWLEGRTPAASRKIFESMTRGQQLFLAWFYFWDDMINGGLPQYFGNHSGNLWREALEATKVFDLPFEKSILEAAIKLFPDGPPAVTQNERNEQLDKLENTCFDKLDKKYYANEPEAAGQVMAYIEKHPDEFFLRTVAL